MPAIDSTIVTNPATVAVTVAEAALIPTTGFAVTGSGPGRTTPPALAFAYVPQTTGLAAGATVTVNLRAGTSSAGTLFGSAATTNSGAGAAAQGPTVAIGLVPAGTENVFPGVIVSSSTGTAQGSATAPIICGVLYLD